MPRRLESLRHLHIRDRDAHKHSTPAQYFLAMRTSVGTRDLRRRICTIRNVFVLTGLPERTFIAHTETLDMFFSGEGFIYLKYKSTPAPNHPVEPKAITKSSNSRSVLQWAPEPRTCRTIRRNPLSSLHPPHCRRKKRCAQSKVLCTPQPMFGIRDPPPRLQGTRGRLEIRQRALVRSLGVRQEMQSFRTLKEPRGAVGEIRTEGWHDVAAH